MTVNGKTLIKVLKTPEFLLSLGPQDFSGLTRLAQHELLLARLGVVVRDAGLLPELDPICAEILQDAIMAADASQRRMQFEADRIRRALFDYDGPLILLKGLAYLARGLLGSEGRFCSDVDILVPHVRLGQVESALRESGWQDVKADPYDDQYYRRWMHELPPLRHEKRGALVDIHHSILPLTARLKPAAEKFVDGAVESHWPRLLTLKAEDMILHCATHVFYDGDLSGGLRNMFDFNDLMNDFNVNHEGGLLCRAQELDLILPFGYALRYNRLVLGDTSFQGLEVETRFALPSKAVLGLMDRLVTGVMLNSDPWALHSTDMARFLLYLRSHWIRMPPFMLARHLMTKAFKRPGQTFEI